MASGIGAEVALIGKRHVLAMAGFLILLTGAMVLYILNEVTFPPRTSSLITPQALLLNSQGVQMITADNVKLSGYYIPGRGASIVLCHEFGSNLGSLFPLASAFNQAGYSVLLFDFRGHGASGGRISTLGAREKLDVLAALKFLKSRQPGGTRGLVGISMGAYAGALAAAEADELRALVLVDPYPNMDSYFRDRLDTLFHMGRDPLPTVMQRIFCLYSGTTGGGWALDAVLPGMKKKTILFISSKSTPRTDGYCHHLYDLTPEPKELAVITDFQKTLALGADKRVLEDRLLRFFKEYLPPGARSTKVISARTNGR